MESYTHLQMMGFLSPCNVFRRRGLNHARYGAARLACSCSRLGRGLSSLPSAISSPSSVKRPQKRFGMNLTRSSGGNARRWRCFDRSFSRRVA